MGYYYNNDHIITMTIFMVHDYGVLAISVIMGYGVATISRLLKIGGLFCKEPYKRDFILQKRPIIARSLHTT